MSKAKFEIDVQILFLETGNKISRNSNIFYALFQAKYLVMSKIMFIFAAVFCKLVRLIRKKEIRKSLQRKNRKR